MMTEYEFYALVIGLFGVFIGLISATSICFEIWLASKSIRADHDRRRKQTTIEYMQKIQDQYRQIFREIKSVYDSSSLTPEASHEIISDKEFHNKAKSILTMLEHLSTGVNNDILDVAIVEQMSGSLLIQIHNYFKNYILYLRRNAYSPYRNEHYSQFESLANNLEKIRKNRND